MQWHALVEYTADDDLHTGEAGNKENNLPLALPLSSPDRDVSFQVGLNVAVMDVLNPGI